MYNLDRGLIFVIEASEAIKRIAGQGLHLNADFARAANMVMITPYTNARIMSFRPHYALLSTEVEKYPQVGDQHSTKRAFIHLYLQ